MLDAAIANFQYRASLEVEGAKEAIVRLMTAGLIRARLPRGSAAVKTYMVVVPTDAGRRLRTEDRVAGRRTPRDDIEELLMRAYNFDNKPHQLYSFIRQLALRYHEDPEERAEIIRNMDAAYRRT